MNIREADLSDSLLLSTLCRDVQILHAQQHPAEFKSPQSPDFAVGFFEKMLAEDNSFIYIVEENGESLGYIFYKLVDKPENLFIFAHRYLLIDQISVRPKAQGQGAGKALMGQAEITAREFGVPRVELGSWAFNTNAHGFFERVGYEQYYHKFWKKIV